MTDLTDLPLTKEQYAARLVAITEWLEANQPDVFRRGLWDAINAATAIIQPAATPAQAAPSLSLAEVWAAIEGNPEHLPTDKQEVIFTLSTLAKASDECEEKHPAAQAAPADEVRWGMQSSCGLRPIGFARIDAGREVRINEKVEVELRLRKRIAEEVYDARVNHLARLIKANHHFDWPYTDAFDDGGHAYQEAKRRIEAEEKATSGNVDAAAKEGKA